MYQPMSPIDHVSYLQQQSQRKFKKRNEYPQLGIQKSPIRQNENRNIVSNRPFTPSKKPLIGGSPLKINASVANSNLLKAGQLSQCSIKKSRMNTQNPIKQSNTCHNHPSKTARYVIQTEDEQIPYCEKCSILLASQGFKVVKLEDQTPKVENSFSYSGKETVQLNDPDRQNELNQFLNNLQTISTQLKQKKTDVTSKMSKISQSSQDQISQIQTYFQEIWQLMEQYKLSMIMNINKHQDSQTAPLNRLNQEIDECLQDAQLMRQDILSSLQIIQQVQYKMFRKVMQSYKQRESSFKDQVSRSSLNCFSPLNIVFLTQSVRMQSILHELADFKSKNSLVVPVQCKGRDQNISMNSENQNPIIQESSGEQSLLKNNISNNQSYFKDFE